MRKWVSSTSYRAALDVIVAARKSAGVTQRELEGRLGKTFHGYVAKIETGERQLNLVEFVAIVRALGLDEIEVFRTVIAALPETLDI